MRKLAKLPPPLPEEVTREVTDDGWIVVRNWDRYQHRDALRAKERGAPAWIKNHLILLSDDDYLELTPGQRGLLHGIWLLYARSSGVVRASTDSLSRKLQLQVRHRQLEALNRAGFIELSASKPPAVRQQSASLEEKREGTTYLPSKSAPAREPDVAARAGAPRGDSARPRTTGTKAYQLAVAMTENGGFEYPLDVYRDELAGRDLTDEERAQLERLWRLRQPVSEEDPF
jgi:hypothetical protein